MPIMRATLHKLRDLVGKLMLPSRKPARRAQRDYSHALPITNLRERLALLSITQSQFAGLCGVHPNTVCNWCAGRTRMNHTALLVLRVLEANHQAAGHVGDQAKGAPRGRPIAPGNPYRFEDRRRPVWWLGRRWRGRSPRTIASSNCCNCPKSLIDLCTPQPERLLFECGALLGDGLEPF